MAGKKLYKLRRIHGHIHEKRLRIEREIAFKMLVRKGYRDSRKNSKEPQGEEDYPVDFVVLWVDGSDPAWQAEKNQYLPEDEAVKASNSDARFRDWDIFKYWFRGVEKYAPWVRNVYLVTWGHVPDFLDLDCPKLKFVRHDQFMPKEYLPTFSCYPTELNLWRIEGLSEHFVYFNDDMFLTAPVKKSDFFRDGLPRYSAVAEPSYPLMNMTAWKHNLYNTAGVVNDLFDIRKAMDEHPEKWFSCKYSKQEREYNTRAYKDQRIMGMRFSHVAVPYRCSTMKEVWERIPDRLDATCRNKFRSMDDIMHQIFQLWEIFSGTFDVIASRYLGYMINISMENIKLVERDFQIGSYRMICINDGESISYEDYLRLKEQLLLVLEKKYPGICSFEKEKNAISNKE